ncbi:hypothetical protein QO002_005123 [Pararhizobium capsulatum DSM 1112]|uniref:Uncharacterized protein n=1 Tax=Pararhizobium capsulatum DSM 1112 TaxID=1121113 RepID=A0ABU0BXB7_9HYPH|nr:hypothetical protein [Pararhizobium capsulatum DSM 1112]
MDLGLHNALTVLDFNFDFQMPAELVNRYQ